MVYETLDLVPGHTTPVFSPTFPLILWSTCFSINVQGLLSRLRALAYAVLPTWNALPLDMSVGDSLHFFRFLLTSPSQEGIP